MLQRFLTLPFLSLCLCRAFWFSLAARQGLWDLSSPTRDWPGPSHNPNPNPNPGPPAVKAPSPNQWTTREFPYLCRALRSARGERAGLSQVYTYCGLAILSSTEGHLGCFQFAAVMNKAALNIQVWGLSELSLNSLRQNPRSGTAGACDKCTLNLIRKFQSVLHSHQQRLRVPTARILSAPGIAIIF